MKNKPEEAPVVGAQSKTSLPPHTALAAHAQTIFSDAALSLPEAINMLLQPLISTFKATSSRITGNEGQTTELFATVVHDGRGGTSADVPIDSVALVIDAYDDLTIDNLRSAYERVSLLKSMEKSDGMPDGALMTTAMIVAKNSNLTLQQISDEVGRITADIPSYLWPDGVAVLSKGFINYIASIPGGNSNGDFFLPVRQTAIRSPAPSVYVQRVIRASADHTFNKLAAIVIPRVAIFQPGIRLPSYLDIIADVPSNGVSTDVYQFNLANELKLMTRDQILASQLPMDSYHIVIGNDVIASIQFQPWQDGGVFVLRGKFPLDIFMIFLSQVVPNLRPADLGFFRNPGVQVSYVLPINQIQFFQTLSLFQSRGNMRVHKDETKILVQKLADEGTTTPFFARLMMGIFDTHGIVSDQKPARDHFFRLYKPVMENLRSCRDAAKDIRRAWEDHREKVKSGAVVEHNGRFVRITENIDRELKRYLDSFLTATGRVMKNTMQSLTKDFGVDIGCLFQNEPQFLTGISKIRADDPILADYLAAIRSWSEPLRLSRNNLEHGDFPPPEVGYVVSRSPVEATEPQVDGRPITTYIDHTLDRVCCFVEELTTYCLQTKMPKGVNICEIPVAERAAEAPVRFRLIAVPSEVSPWVLLAHTRSFDQA